MHSGSLEDEKGPDSEGWGRGLHAEDPAGTKALNRNKGLKGDQCGRAWSRMRSERWEGGSCPALSDRDGLCVKDNWETLKGLVGCLYTAVVLATRP